LHGLEEGPCSRPSSSLPLAARSGSESSRWAGAKKPQPSGPSRSARLAGGGQLPPGTGTRTHGSAPTQRRRPRYGGESVPTCTGSRRPPPPRPLDRARRCGLQPGRSEAGRRAGCVPCPPCGTTRVLDAARRPSACPGRRRGWSRCAVAGNRCHAWRIGRCGPAEAGRPARHAGLA
jgi:hypothetical protein